MLAAHRCAAEAPTAAWIPEPLVANTKSARCLFLPWCEIRRTCSCFLRLLARCVRGSAACIQTARRNRRTGTACSNAIPAGTLGTFHSDRIPASAPLRNLRSAPASLFPPCAASAGRIDPHREARPPAVCARAPCVFCLLFPRRGTRGGCTFDPQMPPSASLDGLQRLQLGLHALSRFTAWFGSNRIATLGRTAQSFP
jgi:hypothetical protein